MNLSIYEIITYFSYLLAFIVYLFYGYKINNFSEPVHEKTKYIYDFILILFTYVPYIVSLLWIFYNNSGIKYQLFIMINVFVIMFLITPMIVFKDDILTGEYSLGITDKDDYLDLNKYDKNGNLIGKIDKSDILSQREDAQKKKEEYDIEILKYKLENDSISEKEKNILKELEEKKDEKKEIKEEHVDSISIWIIVGLSTIPTGLIIMHPYEKFGKYELIIKIISWLIITSIIYKTTKYIFDSDYDTEIKEIDEIINEKNKQKVNTSTDSDKKSEEIKENQDKSSAMQKIIDNINIKFRAAESEYNNRYDLKAGIYD